MTGKLSRKMSSYSPTVMSTTSSTSRVVEATLEGYYNALKYSLRRLDNLREAQNELITIIEGPNTELFEVGFTINKGGN